MDMIRLSAAEYILFHKQAVRSGPGKAKDLRWECELGNTIITSLCLPYEPYIGGTRSTTMSGGAHDYLYTRFPLPRDTPTWILFRRGLSFNMSGVRVFHVTTIATLLLSSLLWSIVAQDACNSSSQPNPIAQQYPDTPTGTFNATLAIVPIPIATARQIIPPQYAILEGAYRALLPSFPEGMYPVLMQAGLDHDIQLVAMNFQLPDFQVSGSHDKLPSHSGF